MMRVPFIGLLLFLFPLIANAQNVKGLVIGESGEAVPAASIYVQETKQGLVANLDGVFQLRLEPGIYHLEVRSMAYEPESLELKVLSLDKEVELTICLKLKLVTLSEIQVTPGEDPAYRIMRKVIEKAPFYQSIVKEAVYETYTKGSGKFLGIPKLMKAMASEEDREMLDLYTDKLFLQESLSEIHFTAPDVYEQNVKAFSSSIPFMDNPESAARVGLISLYRPMWGSVVSPLNPKAFDYYRFRYEGFKEEGDQSIFIIRITPKLKDPKLIEGIIHIADEEWNIRHIDYTGHSVGMEARFTMNFNRVTEAIYLVTDYRSQVDANLLGVRFEMELISSIQYLDIQQSDSLASLEKEKQKKRSLEIKYAERKTDVDSLALLRDSLYWTEARTIVLNEEELQSYQQKDSLQARQDSLSDAVRNPKFSFGDILTGGAIGNDSSALYFRYNGLMGGLLKEYNFVDGWWLGQSIQLDFKKRKNKGLVVLSDIYWGSARKTLLWKTDFSFDYAPLRLGNVNLSVGHTSEDYSRQAGMDRFLNSVFSLAAGRNYAKLFDSEFARLSNGIDLANGLHLKLGVELNRNKYPENHTGWNLFGARNKRTENVPDYPSDLNRLYSRRVNYSVGLEYTPEYYYRILEGKKQYAHSRFPTLALNYKQGVPESLVNDNSVYRQLELSIHQAFRLTPFDRLSYSLVAGRFFNTNGFSYIDYKHFNTSAPWLDFRFWSDSYALLPYYTFSANREWIQAFLNYNTDYLLLKRLPFLQGKMITETLQAKFLHTPDKPYYSEWAYSVNLPGGLGGVGIFFGFDSFRHNGTGLRFSFPLFQKKRNSRSVGVSVSL